MNSDTFGFYFERQGLAGVQGPNDPSGEYFSSTEVAESLTREVIQNSLDARAEGSDVVRVVFELRTISTSAIPGIGGLRAAFTASINATKQLQGAEYMIEAGRSAAKKEVAVLRIGDYGTTGLAGDESVKSPQSALSTLTRSTGASSNDGQRGGSFGIGSAVGPFASQMRTVAYVSKPVGESQTVFAATTKLASHTDKEGHRRQGTGYFTDLRDTDDFHYLRGMTHLEGFDARTECGTDVYVLDYRDAPEDSELARIRRATIENFFVAIHHGHLVVEAATDSGQWTLTGENLRSTLENDEMLSESVLPYYMALTEGHLVKRELKETGEARLYVWIHDSLERKYGTQAMRSPLMKVQNFASAFHVPFAALFICDNEKGNQVLRETEPPTHDRWSDKGPRANLKAIREIRAFIREELRVLLPEQAGAKASIKGLAALLPRLVDESTAKAQDESSTRANKSGNDESAVRLGRPEQAPSTVSVLGPAAVSVQRSGFADPDADTTGTSGRKKGDKPRSTPPGPPRPGPATPVSPGLGRSRIRSRDIRFRSFADSKSGVSVLVLTSSEDLQGDLELAALGGGEREIFGAELANVVAETDSGLAPMNVSGATIKDVSLTKDVPLRLQVVFKTGSRYRLGVKDD